MSFEGNCRINVQESSQKKNPEWLNKTPKEIPEAIFNRNLKRKSQRNSLLVEYFYRFLQFFLLIEVPMFIEIPSVNSLCFFCHKFPKETAAIMQLKIPSKMSLDLFRHFLLIFKLLQIEVLFILESYLYWQLSCLFIYS